MLSTNIFAFAIAIWIYDKTGSAAQLGLTIFFGILPGILLAPIAGAIVDKLPRKSVMLTCDLIVGALTLLVFYLVYNDILAIWHIYTLIALKSVIDSFQNLAYSASISTLVPDLKLRSKANGMLQLSGGINDIGAPIIAGLLLLAVGIEGIILIDIASFVFSVITLLIVKFPSVKAADNAGEQDGEASEGEGGTFWQNVGYGFKFIKARRPLVILLGVIAMVNLSMGSATILFRTLVLDLSNAEVLGNLVSFGGVGGLLGGVLMSVWSGFKNKITGVLLSFFAVGLSMVAVALVQPNVMMLGLPVFAFFFAIPVAMASTNFIWQSAVNADEQGRVFAVRRMIAMIILPISYLAAPAVVDYVVNPALAAQGWFEQLMSPIVGAKSSADDAVVFLVMGVFCLIVAALASMSKELRAIGVVVEKDEKDDEGQQAELETA
ncbi:MAG: MFS transporter [Algicola sp.]|nr:MFS transporter [Algicola sp.]